MNRRNWLANKPRPSASQGGIFKYALRQKFDHASRKEPYLEVLSCKNEDGILKYYMSNYKTYREEQIDSLVSTNYWKCVKYES